MPKPTIRQKIVAAIQLRRIISSPAFRCWLFELPDNARQELNTGWAS